MAQPLYPPAGPQSIGRVLDLSFRIFQMSLASCLLYGALSMIAGQLPNIYFIASGRPLTSFGGGSPLWIGLYLIGVMLALVLSAALLFRQLGAATGQRTGTRRELARGARRLPGYFGLILLSLLVLSIPMFLVGLALGLAGVRFTISNWAPVLSASVLAAIPIVYLLTPMAFAPTALLLEEASPWHAIRLVLRLIRGSWWRTTAVLTIAGVLIVVFYGVVTVIVGIILPLAGVTDLASVSAVLGVVTVVLGSLGLPFFSAVLLTTYGDLKLRKEGLDLAQRVAGVAQS